MPHFRITLAYDGTDFVGWQRQATGTSVQGLLEDALHDLDGRGVVVIGAGRTDAGVHALGQIAGFSLERPLTCGAVVGAINARLPDTVRVLDAVEVPATFNARFDASAKRYVYRLWNADVSSPFERRYSWHVPGAIDLDAMDAAARVVEGRHDFAGFRAAGSGARSSERVVFSSEMRRSRACFPANGKPEDVRDRSLLIYDVSANGFLRHMVRTLVGSLVEIGRGRRPAEWMGDVLATRDRRQAGPTAPAAGLFLVGVEYDSAALAAEP